MKKFDNFDESVKNKMDEMSFSFNEANWEKMNQMLDASRPAKKPFGKLPLISSIVIGSALLIGSAWYVMNNSTAANERAQAPTGEAEPTIVTPSSNANTINNSISEGSLLSSNTSSYKSAGTNINNISSNSSDKNFSNESSTENNGAKNLNKNSLASILTEKKNVSTGTSNNSTPINSLTSASDNDSKATYNEKAIESEHSNTQIPVGVQEGAHLKRDFKTEDIRQELSAVGEEKNIVSVDEELVSLPSVTTTLGQTAETIAAANLVTSVLEEKKAWEYVRVKRSTVTVEGGVINSFGWKVNQTRNGNNISPLLGINYMYNIDSRHSILVGLQYNTLANLGEAKANFSVTSYGFGINNNVTTYKLTDLHYAVMPMKYIYRVDKNNALGFGVNAMYLMNTRTQITNTEFTESNVSSNNSHFEFGYGFNQLNRFNAQLALSYHHSISNKLAINVELNKSLMNVVKDYKYYSARNTSSAPGAIKLSLTYTLFNK